MKKYVVQDQEEYICPGKFKERADYIVKTISKVDEYSWMDCLGETSKKNSDVDKHRDRLPVNRFSCIKVTIYEESEFSDIEIQHHLHLLRPDVSKVKAFIMDNIDNIDLLSREIFKRLERGLDINIRQKQVHFWWAELGKKRYNRDKDSFISV
ncbi:hypothetical protein C1645_865816 [Glomus cerebriforme]|uniref:Uncharacterized protein n=1 Tax=Glomus cerebriforme TaxID=658196 RepID=A0A397S4R4_9GLOM|nr:hypothetical protein C1645_865816 [Glomus cerebriforme]